RPSACLSLVTDPAPPETSTLSLHDALPIWRAGARPARRRLAARRADPLPRDPRPRRRSREGTPARPGPGRRALSHDARRRALHRSEEHTSELQSRENLVCRLLLEKKKTEKQ